LLSISAHLVEAGRVRVRVRVRVRIYRVGGRVRVRVRLRVRARTSSKPVGLIWWMISPTPG
jgi:hypothetical protein